MPSIVTLTVNPAVDKNTQVERVTADDKLRCERPRREPGGGGLNVARALQRLGGSATAVYVHGGPTGRILEQLLDDEEIPQQPFAIDGWTRENLHVTETSTERQYRFGMPGPKLREPEWLELLETLGAMDPAPAYLVASGSLPPGVPADFYGRVARIAADRGTRLIVDTSGEALREAVEAGVYLIKPNLRELQQLAGRSLDSEFQQEEAARAVIDAGRCEAVVVSRGAGGAMLVTDAGGVHLRTPTVPIRSKVGAGDSMVAGLTLGLARGWALPDAVRYGIAAGAAAVMTPGTELCRRDDTERLYEQIAAER